MPVNFAGEPPKVAVTQAAPVNRAPGQTILTGGGNSLAINADGSINNVPELPAATGLTQVLINATANGDNTIVSGTASLRVKVYQLVLGPASAAVNGIFKSGTASNLTGTMVLSTTQALVLNFSPYPWLLTAATDSLVLNLSTTASVGGFASVVQS